MFGERESEGLFEVERGVKLVVKRSRDGTIIIEAQARTEADLRLLLRDFAEVIGGMVGGVEKKRPGPATIRRG